MPVYSMTGYASAGATARSEGAEAGESGTDAGTVGIELRSVNSRFLELAFRLPDELRALEPALRESLAKAFRRGKIELRLSTRSDTDSAWPQPQPEQLNRLAHLEGAVRSWLPGSAPLSVHEVLQWCRTAPVNYKLDAAALQAAKRAIADLRKAREREGERLAKALADLVARLRELAQQVEPLIPAVVERQRQKFVERWNEALEASGAAASVSREALHERAINEAAAFAIRVDVAEELARLRAHLDEFARLLEAGGEVGKRLDFLVQELLREANTLGSKAASIETTGIAVEMKVVIEQLREQVQNLE